MTGYGLAEILGGAAAVVDASNPGYVDADAMKRFFELSGANLLAAEHEAGIDHDITLSAVGAGRISSGYFLAKSAQEDLVLASDIPFTIVRSTPVFEYIYNIVDAGGKGDIIRLPPVRIQPIAADDVAQALLPVALAHAANGILEVTGPDAYQLPMLAEEILTAFEDPRTVMVDENASYLGAHVGDEALTGGDHPRFASTGFEDWLRKSLIPA